MYSLLEVLGRGDAVDKRGSDRAVSDQMMEQTLFLRRRGFDVRNRDVYPAVATKDAKAALVAMWKARTAGWWNMRHLFREHEVCTAEEFDSAMEAL